MTLPQKLLLRILVYCGIVAYLYVDFFVIQGPLSKMVHKDEQKTEEKIAEAKAAGVVARAYYQPIYRAQVEERVREYLWRRGLDEPAGDLRTLREAVLSELIDELLIKIQIKVSGANDYPVTEQEKKSAVENFRGRFPNNHALDVSMQAEGWLQGDQELEMRIAARIQRERYLESQLKPYNEQEREVSAKAWYEKNPDAFRLQNDSLIPFEKVAPQIEDALEALQRKKGISDFRKILRAKAKGKVEIFYDVLHAEDLE